MKPHSLVEVLRRHADRHPDHLAYTFLADGETREINLTYGELDRRARAIAGYLQSRIKAGERALLVFPSDLEFLTAFMGCLYAGVVAVPTLPPRLNQPVARLLTIATDAGATLALTTSTICATLERRFTHAPELRSLCWLDLTNIPTAAEPHWRPPILTGETLAFLQYTSGSTAIPKGVMVSHRNLIHNETSIQQAYGHTPELILVNWMPLHHDGGLIALALQSLFSGGQCVLMSPVDFYQSPARWLQAISRYRAHTSGGPNFAYDFCVRRITPEQRATLDLSSWQVAINAAEPIHAETLKRFATVFAPCGFRRETFYPAYGLAEATVLVAMAKKFPLPLTLTLQPAELEQNRVLETTTDALDGRPLVGCGQVGLDDRVLIVHPETNRLCVADEIGEIWVAGPSVALGYWGRPKETAHTFRARLADDGVELFLRTGDLGFIHNDELFITGRLKDLIIIQGQNHYPQDIELSVAASHPALEPHSGAAFSVEIEGVEWLIIVQEVKRTYRQRFNEAELFQAIRLAVAREHGLPVYAIALLPPASLPKTISGKVQRRAIRTRFLEGRLESLAIWTAPTTELVLAAVTLADVEGQLAAIFQEVLGLVAIDPQADFFELGGDLLGFVQLCLLIETELGHKLPLEIPLNRITVETLAGLLRQPDELSPPPQQGNLIRYNPFYSIRCIAVSGQLHLMEKIISSARVLKHLITHTGPDFVDFVWPYGLGASFLSWLAGQGWVQRSLFSQQVELIRACLSTLDQSDDEAAILRQSIAGNIWYDWRLAALAACSPQEFSRWVSLSGLSTLQEAYRQGRGVILLHSHFVLARLALLILVRSGWEDLALVGTNPIYSLELMGLNHLRQKLKLNEQDDRAWDLAVLSRQLALGQRALERGGIFNVFADLDEGKKGVSLSFHGRWHRFVTGFAELALSTGALVIPVFVTLDLIGRVQVSFQEFLVASGQNHQAQVESLVGQYAEILAEAWTKELGNVLWSHLERHLAFPSVE